MNGHDMQEAEDILDVDTQNAAKTVPLKDPMPTLMAKCDGPKSTGT